MGEKFEINDLQEIKLISKTYNGDKICLTLQVGQKLIELFYDEKNGSIVVNNDGIFDIIISKKLEEKLRKIILNSLNDDFNEISLELQKIRNSFIFKIGFILEKGLNFFKFKVSSILEKI